jgi:hypothetical protein
VLSKLTMSTVDAEAGRWQRHCAASLPGPRRIAERGTSCKRSRALWTDRECDSTGSPGSPPSLFKIPYKIRMLAATIGGMLSAAKKAQHSTRFEVASTLTTPPHLRLPAIVGREGSVNGALDLDHAAEASCFMQPRTSAGMQRE